jgi:hypothetical protein
VRFIRESNYLNAYPNSLDTYDPMEGLDGTNSTRFNNSDCRVGHGNGCTVDASRLVPVNQAIAPYPSSPAPYLWVRTGGSYTQITGTGTQTPYLRKLTVEKKSGYYTATVTLTWEDHGTQQMTLTENFYDWL